MGNKMKEKIDGIHKMWADIKADMTPEFRREFAEHKRKKPRVAQEKAQELEKAQWIKDHPRYAEQQQRLKAAKEAYASKLGQILDRGEPLEDLLAQAEALNKWGKTFRKQPEPKKKSCWFKRIFGL